MVTSNIAANLFTGGASMAGSSLLALIDDIATILDDVALMSKMAAKKPPACWATTWP
jgi:hypothetical protein